MGEAKEPMIALLNKYDSKFYEYALVECIRDGNIKLRTNFTDKALRVSVDEFITEISDVIGF